MADKLQLRHGRSLEDQAGLDAYLDIAATVLRSERRPLSPRAILAAAYRSSLVQPHLYGKTQHKTLQARISEDILARREHSLFFRTAPGRFFLREFLADTSLPEEFRRPIPTRRRFRELRRGPALAVDSKVLKSIATENTAISPQKIYDLLRKEHYRYEDPRENNTDVVFVRSFVCVYKKDDILTYRLGRYRDDRDNFMSRRSIGFSALVHIDEHTLFNIGDFGIVDSGVRAAKIDLDIPDVLEVDRAEASLLHFIWSRSGSGGNDLLAVISFQCPEWFEPTRRRLALNNLTWINAKARINNVEDFDPWSRSVLMTQCRNKEINAESDSQAAVSG